MFSLTLVIFIVYIGVSFTLLIFILEVYIWVSLTLFIFILVVSIGVLIDTAIQNIYLNGSSIGAC